MKKLVLLLLSFALISFFKSTQVIAISQSLFISEIKLGGIVAGQPTEYVELFNDTNSAIDISNYQLEYAKSTSSLLDSQCLADAWGSLDTSSNVKTYSLSGLIQPRGRLVFEASLNDNVQASIRLSSLSSADNSLSVIDIVGFGDASICKEGEPATMPLNGKSIKRIFNTDGHPIDTDNNKNDFAAPESPLPENDILPETNEPTPPPVCDNSVELSEFLSDPDGLEADGGEFVELYNPTESEASLFGCELKSSKSSSDLITFTESDKIPAGGYFVINLADKLTNSSGSITFLSSNREDVVNYSSIHEGEVFAFLNNQWQITDKATPGTANQLLLLSEEELLADGNDTDQLAACPVGKYRNPDTNRCRNIEADSSELSPCDIGESRNPETNRCRKITLASATLAACDEGEERNLATNRCRKIASSSDDLKACDQGYERNPETNRCRKIVAATGVANSLAAAKDSSGPSKIDMRIIFVVLLLSIGYGIYEYKTDIKTLFERIVSKISKSRLSD